MPGPGGRQGEGLLAVDQIDGARAEGTESLLIELQAGQIVAWRIAGRAEADIRCGRAMLVAARLAINSRSPTETYRRW
jgi:hypothetical protein